MLYVGQDLTACCNGNCSLFYGSMGWVSVLASWEYFTDIIWSATLLFSEVLPFPRITKGLLCQFQYHQSYISYMHISHLSCLIRNNKSSQYLWCCPPVSQFHYIKFLFKCNQNISIYTVAVVSSNSSIQYLLFLQVFCQNLLESGNSDGIYRNELEFWNSTKIHLESTGIGLWPIIKNII